MILTADDVRALPEGATHAVPRGTLLTSSAREAAERRRIAIVEQDGAPAPAAAAPPAVTGKSCACAGTTCACGVPAPAPPAADWTSALRARGPDPALWTAAPAATTAPRRPPAARRPPDVETERQALGPRETHLDGCYMGSGSCEEGSVVVVTAVGRNRPRVLAELAAGIADFGGDIQEISQRIVDGWFHTILTVDVTRAPGAFPEAKAALEGLSQDGDYTVHVQHEKVFRYMHRI